MPTITPVGHRYRVGRIDRSFGICSIIDDGTGFDPTHEPDGHFGLTGMRERADKIGAKISFGQLLEEERP